jgi:hypothetical protein
MCRRWVRFLVDGMPDYEDGGHSSDVGWIITDRNVSLAAGSKPKWPRYELESPMNIVFDPNASTHVESDTYRKEDLDFLVGKYRDGTLRS